MKQNIISDAAVQAALATATAAQAAYSATYNSLQGLLEPQQEIETLRAAMQQTADVDEIEAGRLLLAAALSPANADATKAARRLLQVAWRTLKADVAPLVEAGLEAATVEVNKAVEAEASFSERHQVQLDGGPVFAKAARLKSQLVDLQKAVTDQGRPTRAAFGNVIRWFAE